MKRIIALICGLVLVLPAACAGNDAMPTPPAVTTTPAPAASSPSVQPLEPSAYEASDFDTSGEVVLETEYALYGSDAPWVSYTVKNNTDEEVLYGVAYAVETYKDGQWLVVPFPDNQTGWISIGIILSANGLNAHSFSFKNLDYKFADGRYRLIKEVGGKLYSAGFEVGASPITAGTPFGYQALEILPKDYSCPSAASNGDVVITPDALMNIEKLDDFVRKAALGMASMVRIMQYTIEGDPILTDFIYNENGSGYYLFRQDNSRDKFGGSDTGITETIYSYLITHGTALYLSNCASAALLDEYDNASLIPVAPTAKPVEIRHLIGIVEEQTEKRLHGNSTQLKVFSPGGDKSVGLEGKLSYGYQIPGRGEIRYVSDPDGIATQITDVFWLNNDSFVLVCRTTDDLMYYKTDGVTEGTSGYGTGYTITDGQLEIVK